MNYKEFQTIMVEKLMDYMVKNYEDLDLEVNPVSNEDENEKVIRIVIKNRQDTEPVSEMTISLKKPYEYFQMTGDIETCVSKLIEPMESILIYTMQQGTKNVTCENLKSNVIFQLVNTEWNREMLADLPNRQFNDLSIIYRLVMKTDDKGIMSILISNDMAAKLGIDEGQLFECAKINTKRLSAPVIIDSNEVFDLAKRDARTQDTDSMEYMHSALPENIMWVISNDKNLYGAAYVLYEDLLYELAEKIHSNLYILPSSIHEQMLVPSYLGELESLRELVQYVNVGEVGPEERLSNQVYYYDRFARTITIATDESVDVCENESRQQDEPTDICENESWQQDKLWQQA